jgi:hypothetical protein
MRARIFTSSISPDPPNSDVTYNSTSVDEAEQQRDYYQSVKILFCETSDSPYLFASFIFLSSGIRRLAPLTSNLETFFLWALAPAVHQHSPLW